jgi:ribosomal protein L16 Arg81 hydroxylase
MSALRILLPNNAEDLLKHWPTEPTLFRRGFTQLDGVISLKAVDELIDTNCLRPDEVAVIKEGQAVHPGRYTTLQRDEVVPGRLRELFGQGHTISLRDLQRRIPYLGKLSQALQEELGYPNHISGYLTPPDSQGLRHHWDQFTVLVAQLAGQKSWSMYAPTVERPLFGYPQFSTPVVGFTDEQRARFQGPPDKELILSPGDTLLVPRGTIHSPRTVGPGPSLHLTFALKERSRLWLAQELVRTAVDDLAFREEVSPHLLTGDLEVPLQEVRAELITYLSSLDLRSIAEQIRESLGKPS